MKSLIDIPEKMKALVLHGVGDLRYEEIDVPELKEGTVLLKIKACGICSSDIPRIFVNGTYHFPTVPGHEFSGQIVAVGDGADEALLGRRSCVFPTGALADTPREIYPLDYDTLPEPRAGQYHYLMACVDTWEGSASNLGNTDGVLMVTLDVDAKRVMLTTFTREMLVKRPDGGIGRFTYIAKNYGPEALCETVSTHFGAKVDKYIIFSMDNVQTIIDAMGGVYITVTDAEADYLNRYRIARDATTPSMDKAGTYLFGGHAAVIYMRTKSRVCAISAK